MAKFAGKIGYGHTVETRPGVDELVITERKAYGDVKRNSRRFNQGETVQGDISVGVHLSIMADRYAREHYFAIRYVQFEGVLWTVTEVTPEHPRLTIRLGGVYNGPTPSPGGGEAP